MRTLLLAFLVLSIGILGCAGEKDADQAAADAHGDGMPEAHADAGEHGDAADHGSDDAEQAALHKADPAGSYGEALSLAGSMTVPQILADPAALEGQKVRIAGTVETVCPMRGCWMDVKDDATGETIRVKVVDGEIVFPLSAEGHRTEVEGVVEKIELDLEGARSWKQHEAEERGEAFDPETVTEGMVIWRLKGTGAEIEG